MRTSTRSTKPSARKATAAKAKPAARKSVAPRAKKAAGKGAPAVPARKAAKKVAVAPVTKAAAAKKKPLAKAAVVARSAVVANEPALLAGGNPQIPKGDGDAPVQAYIAAMPDWKREVGRRLDAMVVRHVPGVRKAVRWNSPFYGIDGRGWFMSFHVYAHYVKVTFFRGTALDPPPPGGIGKEARWVDIHRDDLDESHLTHWIRQAAVLPGWNGSA
jgi:hypothetical protein